MWRVSVDCYTDENVWRLFWFCVSVCFLLLLVALPLLPALLGVLVENVRNAPLNRKPSDTPAQAAELPLLISQRAHRPTNTANHHCEPNESPLTFPRHGG